MQLELLWGPTVFDIPEKPFVLEGLQLEKFECQKLVDCERQGYVDEWLLMSVLIAYQHADDLIRHSSVFEL